MRQFECVLLVDDDPISNFINKKIVKSLISVDNLHEAKNGMEALDYIENYIETKKDSLPEIILLDINMPIINGYEFLEVLKANYPHLTSKIIVLTSSDSEEDQMKMNELGSDHFITKPLTKEKLAEIIREKLK